MGGILGLVGPAIGAVGSIFGLSQGSPASQVQMAPRWQAPDMTGTANNALGLIQQSLGQNIPADILPLYQQIVGGLINNPGAGGAMQGANIASGLGMGAAGQAAQSGANLTGMAQGAMPNVGALFQQGFDPQQALYGRTLHNVTEQTRAGSEARGINSTPYGAGVENKALSDFNIDWQNQQLQRMLASSSGAGSLMGNITNTTGAGQTLSNMAPTLAMQSGMYPYSTFNQIGADQLSGLGALSNAGLTAQTIPNQAISQYLQYLGIGNQANSVSNQTAQTGLNQANMGFQQSQITGNQLGQSMAGLGNAFGSGQNPLQGVGSLFGNFGQSSSFGWG